MNNLLSNLQLLGDAEHDDLSVAHDALAEIVRLRMLNAELVGVLNAIEVQCENIRKSDWRQWEELASPEEFEGWAKSRARQMAIAASEASAKAKEQT